MRTRMRKRFEKAEEGAVVVEATLVLSFFIFAIFTVLSIVNICFIQAKVGNALATSTKEISQYSYLYYKFNLNKLQSGFHAKSANARHTVELSIDSVGDMVNALSDGKDSFASGDYEGLVTAAKDVSRDVKSLYTEFKTELKEPADFIKGFAYLAGDVAFEEGKSLLGELICRSFMEKNLVESTSDNADSFLRRYRVKDGLDGLHFFHSSLMSFGESDEIQMVVTYEIVVVKLLNIEVSFTVRQCAKTYAWGNGVSQIIADDGEIEGGAEGQETEETPSVWDEEDKARGRYIHAEERAKFTFPVHPASMNSYDGYNEHTNEFIGIDSMYGKTYETKSGVKGKLSSSFNALFNAAAKTGDEITVFDSSGNKITVTAKNIEKSYRIILVVPDNANLDMINEVARAFEQEKRALGIQLTVEVKTGYGSPTEQTPTEQPPSE